MNIENMYVHMFEEFEWSSRGRWFKGYGKFYPNEQLYKYKRMTSGKDFYIQGMFEFDDEKTEKYLAKLF
ncbi:MAG: hypothetical protein OEV44_13055, partial [Spirochaetota bacterium]|nr:hypothetical protein [Spirochaetota bacterium]